MVKVAEMAPQEQAIWTALDEVEDPEIPVISVVELGVVRDVVVEGDEVTVTITPTFSGCPALDVMREEIAARVQAMEGVEAVQVKTQLSPPWTTDWIDEEARDKLRDFGLAPPPRIDGNVLFMFDVDAQCPNCDSTNTTMTNAWGPTACRMLYTCQNCQQPFEQFKPV